MKEITLHKNEINNEDVKRLMDEAIRDQLMTHCFGIPDVLTKQTTYVATKKGRYEIRQADFGHLIVEIDEFPEVDYIGMIPGVHFLEGKKIPYQFAKRWMAGSRLISKTYETEFLYYLFYDKDNPDNPWVEYVPRQVTRGGNTVEQDVDERPNLYMAMHLHSHPGFSCSGFSPGDFKNDTASGSAMLFGLMEQIWKDEPLFHFRAKCGHKFVKLGFLDIFTNPLFEEGTIGPADIPSEEWLAKVTPAKEEKVWDIQAWRNERVSKGPQDIPLFPAEATANATDWRLRMHTGTILRLIEDGRCKKETRCRKVEEYIYDNHLNHDDVQAIFYRLISIGQDSRIADFFPIELLPKQDLLFPVAACEAAIEESIQRAAGFGGYCEEPYHEGEWA
jgi:hypothetical protein